MISVGGLLLMCTRKTEPHFNTLIPFAALPANSNIIHCSLTHNYLNEYYIQGHDNH